MVVEPKLVEQCAPCYLPTHHVRAPPCSLTRVNHALLTVASNRFSTASTYCEARLRHRVVLFIRYQNQLLGRLT